MEKYEGEMPRMKNSGRIMGFEKVKGGENGGFSESRAQLNLKNLQHVPCKFYRQGVCTAGKNCPFSHNLSLEAEGAPCKYFQKGNCKFGARCALAHVYLDGSRSDTQTLSFPYGLNYGASVEMKQMPMPHNGHLQETYSNVPLKSREYSFSMDENLVMLNKSFLKGNHALIPYLLTYTNNSELIFPLKSTENTALHETQLFPSFDNNKTYSSRHEVFSDSVSTKTSYPDISSLSLSGASSMHSSMQHKNDAFSPLLNNSRTVFLDDSSPFKHEKLLKAQNDLTVSNSSKKYLGNNNIYNIPPIFFSKDTWSDPWKSSPILKNNDKDLSRLTVEEKPSLPVSQRSFTFNEFQFRKADDHEPVSNINFRSNPSSFGTSPSSRFSTFFSKYNEYSDNMALKDFSGTDSYHEFVQPYYNEYNHYQMNEFQVSNVLSNIVKDNNIVHSKNSPSEQKLSEKINQNSLSINNNGVIKKPLIVIDDETQFHMDEEMPENIAP
ncbi:uncharacterized protein T551_02349 [Pneumocystis jirovecii RU7]|uniref:C3H1-type domain-containing protein n=1 Tax=Pneumocystis jirovecii (strain RU7) TaxID=1408657 RepID=A0A0W4ZL31_PNEJ7|nr:uncharacterized protein T551_02349 [Pneumocystis jirovecii RU7]KTW29075.1 hypothetical protein T551_02349 [Pneumocystis jirovecii RU7]